MQALTAKKVPELVDAVQGATGEPGKAVSKAVKQARALVTGCRAAQCGPRKCKACGQHQLHDAVGTVWGTPSTIPAAASSDQ